MKNLLEFNNFEGEERKTIYVIDSYRARHGGYASDELNMKQREVLKRLAGKEIEEPESTEDGKYLIKTGDENVPTLVLPKNYVIAEVRK